MKSRVSRRQAVVLFLVLAILAAASLIALGLLARTGSRLDSVAFDAQRVHLRSALRSGVTAVMAQLQSQREALMDSAEPELTASWTLPIGAGLDREVQIALVEFDEGALALSEAARVDVNSVEASALEKFLPAAAAAAIVDARRAGPITSPERLIGLPGLHAEDALSIGAEGRGEIVSSVGALKGGLLLRLGVFAAEPNERTGLGQSGASGRGEAKIDLLSLEPDAAAEELDRVIRAGVGERWKQRAAQGKRVSKLSDVVAALIELGEPPAQWGAWLDSVCSTPDAFVTGRIDLNRAPVEVLATLPGVDAAQARSIVEARSSLDAASRRSPAWPVVQNILTPEQFAAVADRVTTRSLQWRVRVRATMARPRAAFADDAAPVAGEMTAECEAVIDVSGPAPRLAYLRDVSLIPAAITLSQREPAPQNDPGVPDAAPEFEPLKFRELELGTLKPRELNIRGGLSPRMPTGAKPDTLSEDGTGGAEAASEQPSGAARRSPTDRRVGRWTPVPRGGG